jgi:hypothetical protein
VDQTAQGRAQFYSVSTKPQSLSSKTEKNAKKLAEKIQYIGASAGLSLLKVRHLE